MRRLILCAIILVSSFCLIPKSTPQETFVVEAKNEFVGQVKLKNVSVRMIILRHCWDEWGVKDTKSAIQAVDVGASKGLTIKEIGDYNINRKGTIGGNVSWSDPMDFAGLKKFVSDQMKVEAELHDTFIIYTVGHGGGDGSLVTLGQRPDVMKIFAEAAAENEQETFWWQLSCHAAAKLPSISTLTEDEQSYFSMMASSPANQLSYFTSQGPQLRTVFSALANKSREIDPNGDEMITAGEFRRFLNKHIPKGSFPYGRRGDLFYARNDDEPIFGVTPFVRRTPVFDRNNPQEEYEKGYIAVPKRKYK